MKLNFGILLVLLGGSVPIIFARLACHRLNVREPEWLVNLSRRVLGFLHQAISQLNDPRKASNDTLCSIKDAFLGAFSLFFMQCESFLDHQRQMHSR